MMEFDIKKTVSYWFNGAKYDLSVANAMLKSKKYPYALFMGHLAGDSGEIGRLFRLKTATCSD
jgi:hypothetical protein